jgi:uncharacterized oligopeptide transporter (OPT) family protein
MSAEPQRLPEITVKAVILGVVLSVVLAGANAYLGLFAGMTVSGSIPAAVVSMGLLRLFRRSNILENNIVQTAASAGESLAAGVIFTMPAVQALESGPRSSKRPDVWVRQSPTLAQTSVAHCFRSDSSSD